MTANAPALHRMTAASVLILALLIVICQIKLFGYLEWGDESETIVAAKLLASGMPLYSEVFNHHGPLTFLTGYVLERFGSFGVAGHRVPMAVMQWLALLSIFYSPLLRNNVGKRYFTAVAMSAVVVIMPAYGLYGHAYLYQTMAGLFLMVILAQHTVPAIAGPGHSSAVGAAIGNFLLACLPFLAVTYLPAAGLLFLCSLRRGGIGKAILYAGAGVACNLAFLGAIGSFKGYWAFHFYLNAEIMPLYNSSQTIGGLLANLLSLVTLQQPVGMQVAFVVLAVASAALARMEAAPPWRSALLFAAILSLQMRGLSIHGAPFCYACICLAALLLSRRADCNGQQGAGLILMGLCALRLASMALEPDPVVPGRPVATKFSVLAKKITAPGDRVIAYSFQSHQYILADRLPASGNFFYLPWQERYNDAPQLGIRTRVCEDIRRVRPKLMLIDKWRVWGKFSWDSYAGCVQSVMDQQYRQLPNSNIYVRTDYFAEALRAVQGPK